MGTSVVFKGLKGDFFFEDNSGIKKGNPSFNNPNQKTG